MTSRYQNPLVTRYASADMVALFSADMKFSTWRRCWIALAEAQHELGLNITAEQLAELKANVDNIDYQMAHQIEKETRHDVMSHVHTYGAQCPTAKPIIHLGATSAFVGGNTDLLIMYRALLIVQTKLVAVLKNISDFASKYKALPTLGYTHFQPAQLTTVGKRATLWAQDLLLDYEDISHLLDNYYLRGTKGTTGTQASYLALFENDAEKVRQLDQLVCQKLGIAKPIPVCGQTYTRKIDSKIIGVLAGIAQSMHKMTNDLRLLQHLKEIEEPFEKSQIGSSAMAYKRNPMRSERIAALARLVIANLANPMMTMSSQWFERTLDDSANRRISLPESFLAVDGILNIAINVTKGLVVYPKVIEKHVMAELPFMATENIIMAGVKNGGDRQVLHERIRQLSMESAKRIKEDGADNDLLTRIVNDDTFNISQSDIADLLSPSRYTGLAAEQVDVFIDTFLKPIIACHSDSIDTNVSLSV